MHDKEIYFICLLLLYVYKNEYVYGKIILIYRELIIF